MGASHLTTTQRQKEGQVLKKLLLWSFLGSAVFHSLVLAAKPPGWQSDAAATDSEIEIIAEIAEPEPEPEEVVEEPVPLDPPEPEAVLEDVPQTVAIVPSETIPPLPDLAPESQAPQPAGEDVPSDKPLAPTSENINPLTGKTEQTTMSTGGGGIVRPGGEGSGFGNASKPIGIVPNGRPDGSLEGKPDGRPDDKPESTAVRSTPPTVPVPPTNTKPQCINCPRPRYRGKEGTPRVTYDIAPDGRVINIRLRKSSGDPETDRATLEAMSRWQFDPKTVPQGGQRNVRVRVTFEEAGSRFQRQNEERRQAQERRRIAEQERQRREAEQKRPSPPATATELKPSVPATPSPLPMTTPADPPAPVIPNEPPASVAPNELPATSPVEPTEPATPPAPVEEAPPPAESTPPVENSPPVEAEASEAE